MLKKRLIAVLTIQNDIVVQSIGFRKYLPIGKPKIAVEFLNSWGIDEIAYIDISATRQNKPPNFEAVKDLSRMCFVPLSVGGGVKSVNDVRNLTMLGADKVIINQLLLHDPNIVTAMCKEFGSQCIVASIDVKKDKFNDNKPFNYLSNRFLDFKLTEWLKRIESLGVGEIIVNSVDRDGSYQGFDVELFRSVENEVSIPVIALGGAKNAQSFVELFKQTNIYAGAAGNFFHFTEHSVNVIKSQLNAKKENLRLDTNASYLDNPIDENGRLLKKSDEKLEHLLFTRIEKEII